MHTRDTGAKSLDALVVVPLIYPAKGPNIPERTFIVQKKMGEDHNLCQALEQWLNQLYPLNHQV